MIVPHFADQFFWARQVARLGAAPAPLRRDRLTSDALAVRLTAALRPTVAHAAQTVAAQIAREDGTGAAVRVLEQILADARP